MTGLSRCGGGDSFTLASDGRYWPTGYLAADDDPTCDGGWNVEP